MSLGLCVSLSRRLIRQLTEVKPDPLIRCAGTRPARNPQSSRVSSRNLRKRAPLYSTSPSRVAPSLSNSPETLARGWQEECHIRYACLLSGHVQSPPEDQSANSERIGSQHQTEIPLIAFRLKTARPMYRSFNKNAQCPNPSRFLPLAQIKVQRAWPEH